MPFARSLCTLVLLASLACRSGEELVVVRGQPENPAQVATASTAEILEFELTSVMAGLTTQLISLMRAADVRDQIYGKHALRASLVARSGVMAGFAEYLRRHLSPDEREMADRVADQILRAASEHEKSGI